ncbi:restriction endonuclease subunit S [Lacibacter sp.]|uniref:restriction endonuclease subunit S n=1 Tax=Lacibacter sp. TaxID=1915409 RepID=UPI002B4AB4BF|nr:restriction endonuclease subunit S [Lacibacter sp.]HLP36950.1 restriction endonuclease subunit S [Lacibacter sp.]
MRSHYKQLGNYIKQVDERNTKLAVDTLLGVSIEKVFMPSIANTIGTDMSTYKIVKRNQFAYGPVTSRNGDKISIALQDQYDEVIVSQAYTPFEISDTKALLPEYLMMWFRRPEFDRYARFMSHGSAREIFEWDEMCKVTLPVPHPDKQKEIVKEYNAIINRITLNNQLIQKLEETAQAVYKEHVLSVPSNDLETLSDYVESANTGLDAITRAPIVIEDTGVKCLRIQDISKESNYENWGFTKVEKSNFNRFQLKKDDIIVARTGATVGGNMFIAKDLNAVFNNGLIRIRAKRSRVHPIILQAFFKTEYFTEHINTIAFGTSTQPNIQIGDLLSFKISFPSYENQQKIIVPLINVYNLIFSMKDEINSLQKLNKLFLSKLATIEN